MSDDEKDHSTYELTNSKLYVGRDVKNIEKDVLDKTVFLYMEDNDNKEIYKLIEDSDINHISILISKRNANLFFTMNKSFSIIELDAKNDNFTIPDKIKVKTKEKLVVHNICEKFLDFHKKTAPTELELVLCDIETCTKYLKVKNINTVKIVDIDVGEDSYPTVEDIKNFQNECKILETLIITPQDIKTADIFIKNFKFDYPLNLKNLELHVPLISMNRFKNKTFNKLETLSIINFADYYALGSQENYIKGVKKIIDDNSSIKKLTIQANIENWKDSKDFLKTIFNLKEGLEVVILLVHDQIPENIDFLAYMLQNEKIKTVVSIDDDNGRVIEIKTYVQIELDKKGHNKVDLKNKNILDLKNDNILGLKNGKIYVFKSNDDDYWYIATYEDSGRPYKFKLIREIQPNGQIRVNTQTKRVRENEFVQVFGIDDNKRIKKLKNDEYEVYQTLNYIKNKFL